MVACPSGKVFQLSLTNLNFNLNPIILLMFHLP